MSFISKLRSGKFIITAEISPPKGTDTSRMLGDAALLKGIADAVNVTDNQRAAMRMSPIAACSILQEKGLETIMHITCRDRNRLALQSELIGAFALGIRNVLVMSGDHPSKGDHEGAKPVYDLDSVQLLGMIQELNRGVDLSGNKLDGKTDFCMGAVTNTELNEAGLLKLKKKIKIASFLQTQAVFDVKRFSEFIEKKSEIELKQSKQIKIIAGIIPLRSERSALFLNKVPGIRVPDDMIKQIKDAKYPEVEGMRITSDIIKELRTLCDGVHIMPVGNHEHTKKLLEMAGLI
ncbi:methylenetetrahydrofolate reductase (NADPH) [Flavobacteriales bacterium]|uniref:Methylenetetrahydrofolate reductase n=1 Tax=Candidatus Methanoperedens nitratireducens TaxID=1392998 RepID=A0A0P8C5E7_9EURY|nr:methylenetetrahydrofolate reductase [Candidatus Methanoperedens sp. BLZ2]KAB2947464.1 MAG: methylenetetrahydrofolate reductase [Candidatus Methanoperedens sp.]KPQ41878.1 MAG: methylenetetrahydrofolate reductase [Candidatus Methanoperedens sp. BLZ1]MBZ0175169.1 methylenetetrahydrofolate reductase [Candidatus Methanoperedens nitroreducens]CAG0996648.1 methylenetetrahydrofolate reductase (NADPH) [Flavobacteriales bacterium]MCX9078732.1 methylenetetrahydrofolate reductase [Candidatus Methanoper